jgi:antimicrobial peptide system SdpA family protein
MSSAAAGSPVLAVSALLAYLALVVLSCLALQVIFPVNPMFFRFQKERPVTQLWLPEGWAFFTRDAREERDVLYRLSERDEPRMVTGRREFLGFRRVPRSENVELAMLLQKARPKQWTDCRGSFERCFGTSQGTTVHLEPATLHPFLCGSFVVVRQRPLPWAWLGAAAKTPMPARLLYFDVKC